MKTIRLSSDIPKISAEGYRIGEANRFGGMDTEYCYDEDNIENPWDDDPHDELIFHVQRRGWIFGFEQGRFYGWDKCAEEIDFDRQQERTKGYNQCAMDMQAEMDNVRRVSENEKLALKQKIEELQESHAKALAAADRNIEIKDNTIAFLKKSLGLKPRKRIFRRRQHGNQEQSTTE